MAVVTVKSAAITNRDSTPVVISNSRVTGDRVKTTRGVVAVTSGDSIGSKYIACSIPSRAIPVSVRVTAPDIGTTTAGDIGLYQTTARGSAVVDADFFKAAFSLNGGAVTKSEAVNGNIQTVANSEKVIWDLLGLSADSTRDYDVVLTLTGAADASGSVLIEVDYVM